MSAPVPTKRTLESSPPLHLAEDVGAQHGGGTAAAGSPRVDILLVTVVHQQAAVVVFVPELVALFFLQQLPQKVASPPRRGLL